MAITRGYINYTTDQGVNVSIKCDSVTATANGQTVTKFPTVGQGWPFGWRNLRHIYAVSTSGKTYRFTITDPSFYDTLVPGTTTFTNSLGETCTCSALVGEKTLFKYAS